MFASGTGINKLIRRETIKINKMVKDKAEDSSDLDDGESYHFSEDTNENKLPSLKKGMAI